MTDQPTESDSGPARPAGLNVAALGGGRRKRAERLAAAAQRAAGGAPSGAPVGGGAPADSRDPDPLVHEPQRIPAQQTVPSSEPVPASDSTASAVLPGSTASATVAGSREADQIAENTSFARSRDDRGIAQLDRTSPDAPPATQSALAVAEPDEDAPDLARGERDSFDEDDDEDFAVGKTTQQTYVPDAIAKRFHRMQQTGRTAEIIVLTAIGNCEPRLPELIKAARGPMQEGGLFPGLPIMEGGRGRGVQPNSSRVQYQVSPQYVPTLREVAKRHRLKLSVLVRLALGDFFGIPVRIDRVK